MAIILLYDIYDIDGLVFFYYILWKQIWRCKDNSQMNIKYLTIKGVNRHLPSKGYSPKSLTNYMKALSKAGNQFQTATFQIHEIKSNQGWWSWAGRDFCQESRDLPFMCLTAIFLILYKETKSVRLRTWLQRSIQAFQWKRKATSYTLINFICAFLLWVYSEKLLCKEWNCWMEILELKC